MHAWLHAGELLTRMEARGIHVDRAHLAAAQAVAEQDVARARKDFLDWAGAKVDGAQ